MYLTAYVEYSKYYYGTNTSIEIIAGSGASAIIVANNCTPITYCDNSPTVCAINVDVTSSLSTTKGGSLFLNAQVNNSHFAQGYIPPYCTTEGNAVTFEVSYTVSWEAIPTFEPTADPTSKPTTSDGINGIDLVSLNNAPYYIIFMLFTAFLFLGVVIMRIRDENENIVRLSFVKTCVDFGLLGYNIASEGFYLFLLFTDGRRLLYHLAFVVLLALMCSCAVTTYLLLRIFNSRFSATYVNLFDYQHMSIKASLFSPIVLLMLLEPGLVRYLPWRMSDTAVHLVGFPDSHIFKVVSMGKFLHLTIVIIVQGVVLFSLNKEIVYQDTVVVVVILLFLSSSFLSLVLFGTTSCVRLLATPEQKEPVNVDNPLRAVSVAGTGTGTELNATIC